MHMLYQETFEKMFLMIDMPWHRLREVNCKKLHVDHCCEMKLDVAYLLTLSTGTEIVTIDSGGSG